MGMVSLGSARQRRNEGPFKRRLLSGVTLMVLGVGLAGCAIKPDPLTLGQHQERARADRAALIQAQEPVAGPITLAEAMARAVKYNLDHRLALMEEAVQSNQLSASKLGECRNFRVWAITMGPKEAPDGTTEATKHTR